MTTTLAAGQVAVAADSGETALAVDLFARFLDSESVDFAARRQAELMLLSGQ